jgi:hypothetical protein
MSNSGFDHVRRQPIRHSTPTEPGSQEIPGYVTLHQSIGNWAVMQMMRVHNRSLTETVVRQMSGDKNIISLNTA